MVGRSNILHDFFALRFENVSTSEQTIKLWDISNANYAPYARYTFYTPYVATYSLGAKFDFQVNGVTVYNYNATSPQTATQIAANLTALGQGTWHVAANSITGITTWWVNYTGNVINYFKINLITYPYNLTEGIGTSAVFVGGAITYAQLLNWQFGCSFKLNFLQIYGKTINQALNTLYFNDSNPTGHGWEKWASPTADNYQFQPQIYQNCYGFVLDGNNTISYTIDSNSWMQVRHYYAQYDVTAILFRDDYDFKLKKLLSLRD